MKLTHNIFRQIFILPVLVSAILANTGRAAPVSFSLLTNSSGKVFYIVGDRHNDDPDNLKKSEKTNIEKFEKLLSLLNKKDSRVDNKFEVLWEFSTNPSFVFDVEKSEKPSYIFSKGLHHAKNNFSDYPNLKFIHADDYRRSNSFMMKLSKLMPLLLIDPIIAANTLHKSAFFNKISFQQEFSQYFYHHKFGKIWKQFFEIEHAQNKWSKEEIKKLKNYVIEHSIKIFYFYRNMEKYLQMKKKDDIKNLFVETYFNELANIEMVLKLFLVPSGKSVLYVGEKHANCIRKFFINIGFKGYKI